MSPKSHSSITIYRGWDTPSRYVWSPFVTKLEFRLRTSNVRYTCAAGSTHAGPKGKIPYLQLSSEDQDTECLADSTLIIRELSRRALLEDINGHLGKKEKGQDLAIRALLEDKLCFYHTYERWVQNYYTMRDHALWAIPYPLRVIIGQLAYRGNVRKLYDQGTGRFSETEIHGFIREVWEGVNDMLEESRRLSKGEGCFWILGGPEPSEADATLFGFVVSVLVCDAGPTSGKLIRGSFPTVVEYAGRIHREWFPDYEIWPCE